ncbi:hypothetical protein OPV22_028395 [Ensete ventricosum]|uniref:C3H1-type domain-containing protein n=1 Tax=Ensete ventricosum TaxID=4639 RepID=A0AAV8Q893_ENSVE|nr:hypothetical protein OPV22_028395 [Ensete ventricosum]
MDALSWRFQETDNTTSQNPGAHQASGPRTSVKGGKELVDLRWLRSVDLGFRSITTPMPGARHNALFDSSSNASPGKLEETMSRLNIDDEDGREGADGQPNPYPDRPGEPNCSFYLRTGLCRYGSKCKYNHPNITAKETQCRDEPHPRDGQPDCQFFLKTGTCKFGATCKYYHPQDKHDAQLFLLNDLGLPIRKGEKSCPHYMKTGYCKFGVACKFNHPQPVSVGTMFPISGSLVYGYTGSSAPIRGPSLIGLPLWPSLRTPYMTNLSIQGFPSYMPLVFPSAQATAPVQQGWTKYMGSASIPSNKSLGSDHIPNSKHRADPGSSMTVIFPERPDQPECQYYMKTGGCKYGSSCKYHHPKERNQVAACTIGPFGLPLRPGEPACTFYAAYGSCKYGASCKFDHPYVVVFPLPDSSLITPHQRVSKSTWMAADSSSGSLPTASDEFKSVSIGEMQGVDNNDIGSPCTQTSPSHTTPHSESSINQSD